MIPVRFVTPIERIEKEIKNHSNWCHKNCKTFNSTTYRKARLEQKLDKLTVQKNKYLCHT